VSEPKRYAFKVNEENDFDLIEHSNGEWVRYEDYARLKAEVERSRDQYNGIIDTQLAEIERLNSELFTCSCANANMHKYKNENARLKQSLRLQIEQNALAQVGFKMYQDNVDSGGLHKDRKDAIARLEAENTRLKDEVERLTAFTTRTIIPNEKLKAEVKRLKDSKLKRRKRGRTIL